jgi:hypothetical protein
MEALIKYLTSKHLVLLIAPDDVGPLDDAIAEMHRYEEFDARDEIMMMKVFPPGERLRHLGFIPGYFLTLMINGKSFVLGRGNMPPPSTTAYTVNDQLTGPEVRVYSSSDDIVVPYDEREEYTMLADPADFDFDELLHFVDVESVTIWDPYNENGSYDLPESVRHLYGSFIGVFYNDANKITTYAGDEVPYIDTIVDVYFLMRGDQDDLNILEGMTPSVERLYICGSYIINIGPVFDASIFRNFPNLKEIHIPPVMHGTIFEFPFTPCPVVVKFDGVIPHPLILLEEHDRRVGSDDLGPKFAGKC